MAPFVFFKGPLPHYLLKVFFVLFLFNFLFPSHIILRIKWGHLTVFPRLSYSNQETSGMPFIPFKVSTSFHKLVLGVPGVLPLWAHKQILWARKRQLQFSFPPALILFGDLTGEPSFLLSLESPPAKCEPMSSFVPVLGTTRLCFWLLKLWVLDTVGNENTAPSSHCSWSHGGNEPKVCHMPNAQEDMVPVSM